MADKGSKLNRLQNFVSKRKSKIEKERVKENKEGEIDRWRERKRERRKEIERKRDRSTELGPAHAEMRQFRVVPS